MTSFPTLLPPGAISPYDENSRLRRELHGLKKRYRALEVEIKREPISRTQLLREVYTGVPQSDESQPLPATTDEQMEIALTRLNDQWEGELKKVSAEYEDKVAEAEKVRDEAIDQMKAFRKQSDAQLASREALGKEARIEQMRRQIARRILNQNLVRGWSAWHELWSARTYAFKRLRQVANHLMSPELARAFGWWNEWVDSKKQQAQVAALERETNSLQGQLRRTQFEAGQLAMLKVAHEDEIEALKAKVDEYEEQATARQGVLADASEALASSEDLRAQLANASVQLAAAQEAREQMASTLEKMTTSNEELMQRLLAEQRRSFEEEVAKLQRQLAMRTDAEGGAMRKLKEQVSAEAAAKAHQERVELLHRQASRRILNKDIANGFAAWYELWSAKTYAMGRLREVGNKLHAPEMTGAFGGWVNVWRVTKEAQMAAEFGASNERYVELEAEVAKVKAEMIAVAEERNALRERVTQLDGGVAEAERLRKEQEQTNKEERIELLHRKASRRMLNKDIADGFAAWQEMWSGKTYAMGKLREVANTLHAPELAIAFDLWSETHLEEKQQAEFMAVAQRAAGLDEDRTSLADELQRLKMEYEAQMTSIQEEHRVALERQLIALTGSVEEQRAMIEAKAKEERIEILHRQAMRRILNKDIANGFAAWQELWSAKTYARDKLRECANRLHAPELANTYRRWESDWRKEMAGAEIAALAQQVAGLSGSSANLNEEVTWLREENARLKVSAEEETRLALERLTIELTGNAHERAAVLEAKAKEERIEILHRKASRRILNKDIADGFAAWYELWSAKTYARDKLRECANRLHAPALSQAFAAWEIETEAAHAEEERREREDEGRSMEQQLRQSRHNAGQLALQKVAQEDLIRELKAQISQQLEELKEAQPQRHEVKQLHSDYEALLDFKESHSGVVAHLERQLAAAAADADKKRSANETLMQQLLDEQRVRLEDQMGQVRAECEERATDDAAAAARLKERIDAAHEMTRARDRELAKAAEEKVALEERHADDCARIRQEGAEAAEAVRQEMRGETTRLKKRIEKVREEKTKEPLKRGASPLGNFAIEDGEDAPPIAIQLGNALRTNKDQVLNLFKDWDADGNGNVSGAEFRNAMFNIGLEYMGNHIDALFTSWDFTGDGMISYSELEYALKTKPSPSRFKKAAKKVAVFGSTVPRP